MNRVRRYINIGLTCLSFVVYGCTLGQVGNSNDNKDDNSNQKNNKNFSLILIKPDAKDFSQLPVNPTISFKFNRHANHIDLDNIYMVDNNTSKPVVIEGGILPREDIDGNIVYSISPKLAYNNDYKLVFSALISDDEGNRLNSLYYVFHTINGDNPDVDTISFHVSQPGTKVSVDINQDIIFTSSEHIDYKGSLSDIVSLHEKSASDPTKLDISIQNEGNNYVIKHGVLDYDKDYFLVISDPEHKIATQNIGNFIFPFHTAENADNAQLVSQDTDLQADSAIIVYVKPGAELVQNNPFTLKHVLDNSDIEFDYQRFGDFYVLKPKSTKSTTYYGARYELTITYASKKQQSIFIGLANAGDYDVSLYGKDHGASYCNLTGSTNSCDSIVLKPYSTCQQPYIDDSKISLYRGNPKGNGVLIPAKVETRDDGYSQWGSKLYSLLITPSTTLEADKQYVIVINQRISACSSVSIGKTTLLLTPK